MDIFEACKMLRHCNERFCTRQQPTASSVEVSLAVEALKTYLERARADGKVIRELDVAENLLFAPEGMRWVMPFVTGAEGMLAHKRRMQQA